MLKNLFTRQCFQFRAGLGLTEHYFQNCVQIASFRASSYQSRWKPPISATEVGEKDVLTEKLQGAKSLGTVMEIAKSHHAIMNNKHLFLTFDVMDRFLRANDPALLQGINTEELKPLCRQVVKRVRHFSASECITILKILSMLDVPPHSAVVQSICQMIRHSVNELTLGQLNFLHFVLRKQKSTPLTSALMLAIPIVVEAQLSSQGNPENVAELIRCLKLIARFNPNASTIEKMCAGIAPKCGELDMTNAFTFLFALTELPNKPENYLNALSSVVNAIENNLGRLSPSDCQSLLFQILNYPEVSSCSATLFTNLSRVATANNWSLHLLANLLGVYNRYHFVSMELLDATARKILEDPQVIARDKRISILSVVEGYSRADYLPGPFLNTIVASQDKFLELQSEAPQLYVKLVALLAILDAATPALVESACNEEFVSTAYAVAKSKGKDNIFLSYLSILNQYAQLYLENYTGKFLTKTFVEESMKSRTENGGQPADPILQKFLEIGLGGPRFVLNGLWTRLGHFIDHVIVMRKGDFPVAINRSVEEDEEKVLKYPENENGFHYIEDLVIPEDAKILAVLVPRKDWMSRDPPRLTGWATFQQRSLSKMGYNTIIVRSDVLRNLLDREKVPFLMREINEVLRQNSNVTSQCV